MSTKDWLEKDYYKVLGVPKNASEAEIKKAFRKLARENHPDQHAGDTTAETRFKEVTEAYDVLSDSDKRKEYDEARKLFGAGFRFPGGDRAAAGSVHAGHLRPTRRRRRVQRPLRGSVRTRADPSPRWPGPASRTRHRG